MKDMLDMTLAELSRGLSDKSFSSEALTRLCIDRIENTDKNIGAFITKCADTAIERARDIDKKRAAGEILGALAGIPYAAKDNICTRGIRTTCASRMLESFVPPYNATVIDRLNNEGCVLLGKLNMDEFAMGSVTDTSAFGLTRNPLDIKRTAGGSSGGAAAAVAAKQAFFTLGSDTGGSVRQPASFCRVVGIKPTYGTVSRYGLVAFASSLEQIGPITSDVYSNALALGAIAGADSRDATTNKRKYDFLCEINKGVSGLCIGVPFAELEKTSEDVRDAIAHAAKTFAAMGAKIIDVSLPDTDALLAAYYVISSAEASSNLSRFDGIRYGYRASSAESIDELFIKSRSEGFGDEVKRRIMLGTYALSRDGRDAYYKRASAARKQLIAHLEDLFKRCDCILMPVSPSVAYEFENKKSTPLEVYLEDSLCVLANMAGVPAISMPCGKGEGGMPVGMQLMGRAHSEPLLYRIAMAFEREVSADERI